MPTRTIIKKKRSELICSLVNTAWFRSIDPKFVPKSPNFSKGWPVRGHSMGGEAPSSTGRTDTEPYIICDKSEEMKHKESSYAERNPAGDGKLSLCGCGRRCVATASRVVEGSGKDHDSFGFDFSIVAAVIFLPWCPFLGPAPDKLKHSVIQLLPLHSCHRAHSLIIPVFSLQTEEPGHRSEPKTSSKFASYTVEERSARYSMSGVTGGRPMKRLRCFPLVCFSIQAAMQKAVSETEISGHRSCGARRCICLVYWVCLGTLPWSPLEWS